MGAYLSKPVTDKISSDEHNEFLKCGASSMQGWRIYQEDAHNACLNYDENRSLFAVYDGHGGNEVAAYTAAELPEFIKKTESYKIEEYSQALTNAFLDFDATLVEPDIQAILKEIAGSKEQDDSDYDGEEVDHLCREASMPLEEVIAKYSEDGTTIHFQSPNIRTKRKVEYSSLENEGCSSSSLVDEFNDSSDPEESANNSIESSLSKINSSSCSEDNSLSEENSKSKNIPEESVQISHIEENKTSASLCNGLPKEIEKEGSSVKSLRELSSNSISQNNPKSDLCSESETEKTVNKVEGDPKMDLDPLKSEEDNQVLGEDAGLVNGETPPKIFNGKIKDEGGGKENCDSSVSEKTEKESENQEKNEHKEVNGKLPQISDSKGGKGKGKSKGKGLLSSALAQAMKVAKKNEKRRKAAIKAEQIYKQIKKDPNSPEDEDDDDEDDDEDDENFENNMGYNNCEELDSSEDDDDEEDDDDDDEDDDEDDDDECSNDIQYNEFPMNMREEPGYDSGCTACVAILNGYDLYVANVGDSRCVVCRSGEALDMSIDHKPEDEPEAARIMKAGGRITGDGRVNGGLNLSRALGDHSYKQNKNLTAAKQMISPLPDIRTLKLTPEDSFMVIACDGIWNSMSSQQVCDFIKERLDSHPKLSTIAEEMFDHCLSPDAHGDGTGCDNMTCIIVKFNSSVSVSEKVKRPCEDSELEKNDSTPQDKRCKLDTDVAE